ncbi:MAG: CHAT domain-containing protein [Proteobacteria bacterium]|nr:CHAT domain-containing protein [Pseudomonadota bacterium]MBU1595355.1 CHAT domain-containing protein [Pseudomonadota bacterium]
MAIPVLGVRLGLIVCASWLVCACGAVISPKTQPLPEEQRASLAQGVLQARSAGARGMLSLRSGAPVAGPAAPAAEVPMPAIAGQQSDYVPPPKFRLQKAGDSHFFNFTITPDYEASTRAYLSGDGDAALAALDRVDAAKSPSLSLRWRSAYDRVLVLVLMSRPELAEAVLPSVERNEIAYTGTNIGARALRAEVRYFAGDLAGALRDAADVLGAIGDWRMPVSYGGPPKDMDRLAVTAGAQIRAVSLVGMVHFARRDFARALPWLELADQLINDVFTIYVHPLYGPFFPIYPEVYYGRGLGLAGLGATLTALGTDPARAELLFARANAYFDSMGFPSGKVLIEVFRAFALFSGGRFEDAASVAGAAADRAEKLALLDVVCRLQALRGEALLKLKRFDGAESALRQAQSLVDLLSGTLQGDAAKVRFGSGKEAISLGLAAIDVQRGDLARLFEDLERGRARAFVSLLAGRGVGGSRGGEIAARVKVLDRDIAAERRRKASVLAAAGDLDRERVLLDERSRLIEVLRTRDADLADALSVSAADLASVRARLAPDEVLLYTLPAADPAAPLSALVATRTGARLAPLGLTPDGLKASLAAFTQAREANSPSAERQALARMGSLLKAAGIEKPKGLYVVPSGDLHFVPWGALAVEYPVSVLPVAGFLMRSGGTSSRAGGVAVVGDPEFGQLLPQLPGAQAEALAVSKGYGAPALIGAQATPGAVRQAVGSGARVLHLATHALFDPTHPLLSALFLTDGSRAEALTAEAIYADPLPAGLVVLSACETGMGRVVAGDDLLGLTRSFYLSGAQAVLASLWPVNDEATELFMSVFHQKARSGDLGQAWLAARNAVRSRGLSPSDYGAFVFGGRLGGAP